jgi:hypothetical protein
MAFDRDVAERTLVEIVDALNGDRVVGMGFRLACDVIATSCRCLPRPTGRVHLPDPDAPGVTVLVRVRRPRTDEAAFAIAVAADPCSGLALLRSASAGGLTVPEELNPTVAIEALLGGLEPALPAPAATGDAPVLVPARERRWVEGTARGSAISLRGAEEGLGAAALGAPVFGEDGRVLGVVTSADEPGPRATMCLLADHLPGWSLRAAGESSRLRTGDPAASYHSP